MKANSNKSVFTETIINQLDLVVQSFYTLIIAIVAFLVVFEIYFKFSILRKVLWVIFSICRKFLGLFGIAKGNAIGENENESALSGNGEVNGKKSMSADNYSSSSGFNSGIGDGKVLGTGTTKSVTFNSPNDHKKQKMNNSDQEDDTSRIYFSHFNDFNKPKTSNSNNNIRNNAHKSGSKSIPFPLNLNTPQYDYTHVNKMLINNGYSAGVDPSNETLIFGTPTSTKNNEFRFNSNNVHSVSGGISKPPPQQQSSLMTNTVVASANNHLSGNISQPLPQQQSFLMANNVVGTANATSGNISQPLPQQQSSTMINQTDPNVSVGNNQQSQQIQNSMNYPSGIHAKIHTSAPERFKLGDDIKTWFKTFENYAILCRCTSWGDVIKLLRSQMDAKASMYLEPFFDFVKLKECEVFNDWDYVRGELYKFPLSEVNSIVVSSMKTNIQHHSTLIYVNGTNVGSNMT